MSRNFRGNMPLCDRMICTGLLLSRQNGTLPDAAEDKLKEAKAAFFASEELRPYSLRDARKIAHAIEQTLAERTSFYTVQRRWELPLYEAGRFGVLRRVYCACILRAFALAD